MGYKHIENLPKVQNAIFMFKEVYALEKIHGTSAHISFKKPAPGLDGHGQPELKFSPGGEKYDKFVSVFDVPALEAAFLALGHDEVVVFGEAYGGKCQGMSATYGKDLKFIVFEVKIGEAWLNVVNAEDVAKKLGLEFVAYERVPCTPEALTAERDRPSRQAVRNGIVEPKPAEGIVIRPLEEYRDHRGERICAKFKREEFSERASKADTQLDPAKAAALAGAKDVALEWVTPERMRHVVDKVKAALGRDLDRADTKAVIEAMVEDVTREGAGEFQATDVNLKAVRSEAGRVFGSMVNVLKT